MPRFLSPLLATAAYFVATSASALTSPPVTFVPWKILQPGAERVSAPLVLVWIPSSADDFKHSEMLVSRPLALVASQCVGLQVVRSDDAAMIEKLGATGKLPLALLVSSDWRIVAKTENDHGALRTEDVEKMVEDELEAREEAAEKALDDARRKAANGDRDAAITLYRKVTAQRCAFPRCAREASRALKRLGVDEN